MADPTSGRPRPQRSVVFPSPVVLLSIAAVAMAVIAFFVTRGAEPTEREVVTPAANASSAPATADPRPSARPTTEPKPKPKPKPIERADFYVEVYNNSGITGLAGTVGEQATGAGWNVVGTDNWYGAVPTNTVYYPPKLSRAAKQLALDLGIDRTAAADGAMKLDRLTVILTGSL